MAHGYQNELWTLRRVGELVRKLTGKKAFNSEVWRLLKRAGWSPQKPVRQARERDEKRIDANLPRDRKDHRQREQGGSRPQDGGKVHSRSPWPRAAA